MNTELLTAFGIAASLSLAAIAALWRLVLFMSTMTQTQNDYRHKLRDDLTSIILQSENRLSRRIERLEEVSIGFRQHARDTEGLGDGN